jgi:hypothetical protein
MFSIHKWATAIAAGALILIAAGTASAATVSTVYSNIPSTLPGNFPSWGFEAYQTSEFGGLIGLAAGQRTNPVVTVTMSSWACQSGSWNGTCVTTPGTVFSLPITLNIYAVGSDGTSVGDLLATDTQTFKIPFRPSTDPVNCSGTTKWFDGTSCFNGLAHNIRWDLGGRNLTLPDNVIVAVMYNTSDEGYQPIGSGALCHSSGGCGYDSLNVALVPNAPFVGTDPLSDDAYFSSITGGWYCDNGLGGLGIFRLDTGCDNWTNLRPVLPVPLVLLVRSALPVPLVRPVLRVPPSRFRHRCKRRSSRRRSPPRSAWRHSGSRAPAARECSATSASWTTGSTRPAAPLAPSRT